MSFEDVEWAVGEILKEVAPCEEVEMLDLANTPARVAKMYREEILSSYQPGASQKLIDSLTTFPAQGSHEMVTQSNISFHSTCAHHMLPFFGEAYVGYIPGEKIVGLSKLARVVDFYSKKLQTQERMTSEIADFLFDELKATGVIVVTEAFHLCMAARGVKKDKAVTRVAALRGKAEDPTVRGEFYRLISLGK